MTVSQTHPALARALAAREYSNLTPVQIAVLEDAAVDRDLLVSAQTGSGKTVAFGLALAKTLLADAERFEAAAAPLALVVAPTRELALQVSRELDWLYAEAGAKLATCVGGMDVRSEARALNFGAHIVVGTPGRLRDHLERKRLDLSQLRAVVLDEADEMLDLGFREDLEFLLDATPPERRTLLFSATMPKEIEALATRYQRDGHRIETARKNEQHADIEYRAVRVAPSDIENAVVNVLRYHEARATLVFCTTREAVKRMHGRLLERGFAAVALSGELTQAERSQALLALRDGRARVLVATDVAARGLDLPDLSLVIHAELPNNGETLLHRSGRTGRAGKKGLCVLIVPYNRRRKAEALLGAARLRVKWEPPPNADDIRKQDRERFLADPMFAETAGDEDRAWVEAVTATRSPEEIALALVRLCRARLPEPEELTPDFGPPRRDGETGRAHRGAGPREPRQEYTPRHERAPAEGDAAAPMPERREQRAPRPPRPVREDNREMVWFRLNIGRDRNADPRWILPLVCRAGGVSKAEVGAIRIQDRDTRFQIVADAADQFAETVRTGKHKEGQITRVGPRTEADDAAVMAAIDAIAKPEPANGHGGEPASAPSPNARERDRERPRWRDRGDAKGTGKRPPPRGGDRVRHQAGPRKHDANREAGAPRHAGQHPHDPKRAHKHKKKHRQAEPAAS